MLKSIFVALALALSLASGLAVSSAALSPAHAVPVAKPHIEAGTHVNQVNHRRHHGYGGPVVIHRSTSNSCYWLKRRALNTGSRYWWHRYQECRYR